VVSLRRKRILVLAVLFGAVAAASVLALPVSVVIEEAWTQWKERPRPIVATETETAAILRAVIAANEDSYGLPAAPPPPPPNDSEAGEPSEPGAVTRGPVELILLDRSEVLCPPPPPGDQSSPCAHHSMGDSIDDVTVKVDAPRRLKRELQLANVTASSIPDVGLPAVHHTASSSVDAIFRTGGWNDFYERYPGTAGTLEASVPVLTEDRSQALIYVAQSCGGTCGIGFVHLLRRTPEGWQQVRRWMVWIS
jgi:hypothetical protein